MPRSLGSQLFFAMWGLALVLIGAAVAGSVWLIDGFVQKDVQRTLASGRVGFAKYLDMRRTLMARAAESAAAIPMLKATLGIEGLDRETASVAAEMVRELAGAGFCVLQDPGGTGIATTLSAAGPIPALSGETAIVSIAGRPHLIGAAQVTSGEATVGRVILGRAIDRAFAEDVHDLTGSDAFLLFEGRLLANSGPDVEDAADGARIGALSTATTVGSDTVTIGDLPFQTTAIQLPAATTVVLARRVDGLMALRREFMWIVAAGGLIGGLLALAVARLVASRIARPLSALTEASARFAHGDQEAAVEPAGSLETQSLGLAFNAMVRDLEKARTSLVKAERLAAIGQITVTMNHEMNNPLHGLLSSVEMALLLYQQDPKSPDLQEVLETIQQSSLELRDVMRRISSLNDTNVTNYAGDVSMIDIHGGDS